MGETLLKKNITPERALAEFKIAVEIWFGYMDDAHKYEALVLVQKRVGKSWLQ